jgi:hypothetical protein
LWTKEFRQWASHAPQFTVFQVMYRHTQHTLKHKSNPNFRECLWHTPQDKRVGPQRTPTTHTQQTPRNPTSNTAIGKEEV